MEKFVLAMTFTLTQMFILQNDSMAQDSSSRLYSPYSVYIDIGETSYKNVFNIIKEFANRYDLTYHLSIYDRNNTEFMISLLGDDIDIYGVNNDISKHILQSKIIFHFNFVYKKNNEKSKTKMTEMISAFRELIKNSPSINIVLEENDIE